MFRASAFVMFFTYYVLPLSARDYAGGLLDMAVYAVPSLQRSPFSNLGMNILYDGSKWDKNVENFCFT